MRGASASGDVTGGLDGSGAAGVIGAGTGDIPTVGCAVELLVNLPDEIKLNNRRYHGTRPITLPSILTDRCVGSEYRIFG